MKKRILATALAVGILTTGAYAYDCQKGVKKGHSSHKYMKKHNKMRGHSGIHMFSKLDLTGEQKHQLSILKDEMKLEMKKQRGSKKRGKILSFVTSEGFDKEAYKADASINQDKRVAIKAGYMEKAFNLLTKEQVEKLISVK